MSLFSLVGFFTALFNIGSWLDHPLYTTLLFFDGIAYEILAYSFKVFQIVCTLNFNSLYGIIGDLVTRLKSVVLVFVVFKLGLTFIGFMLNPEEAAKKGKEILINIFVAGALLISYDAIFTFFNELSMLIIGNPSGYQYTVLKQVADIDGEKDNGLIVRFIFGDAEIDDIGNYLAYSTASIFLVDANDETRSTILTGEICDGNGHCTFSKLTNLASKIGKSVTYHPLLGFVCALFMIYTIIKSAIQIGVRMFKMMIIQLFAPIAITSIVDGGLKGKVFTAYYKTYLTVFIEAFIRMFSMLLISVFVCKFFVNIGDFFSEINQDEWYTTALVTIIIVLAAYKFAGDIPAFVDKLLGTKFLGENKGGFLGGFLGMGLGAIAGFAGGIAGGSFLGGLRGLASGAIRGEIGGSKGNNIAEVFKNAGTEQFNRNKTGVQNRLQRRASIAERGGLGQVMLGGAETAFGVGRRQDAELRDISEQSTKLEAFAAAGTNAVKNAKTGTHFYAIDSATGQVVSQGESKSVYSNGYNSVKMGEDKSAYAQQMLSYDRTYQSAMARLEADRQAGKTDAELAKDQRIVEIARTRAIKRAEDNYDATKKAAETNGTAYQEAAKAGGIEDYSDGFARDVAETRAAYDKSRPKSMRGSDINIKKEQQRLYNERTRYTNRRSYARTHGQNPNKKS